MRPALLDAASFSIEINPSKDAVSEAAKVGEDADLASTIKEEVPAAVVGPTFQPANSPPSPSGSPVGLVDASKLVFLDTHSWVCSVDLEGPGNSSVSCFRHFLVPYDWFSGTRDVICAVAQRDVLFARNDDVAMIKGGLEYAEKVNVENVGKISNESI